MLRSFVTEIDITEVFVDYLRKIFVSFQNKIIHSSHGLNNMEMNDFSSTK